jgi:hypothetical protein
VVFVAPSPHYRQQANFIYNKYSLYERFWDMSTSESIIEEKSFVNREYDIRGEDHDSR